MLKTLVILINVFVKRSGAYLKNRGCSSFYFSKKWGRWWVGAGKNKGGGIIIIRWFSLPQPKPPEPPPPQDNSLGSRIRYFRRLSQVTRSQLSTLTGYPVNTLARYEQNKVKRPNPHILLKITQALKLEPNKLISIQHFQPISDGHKLSDPFDYIIPPKDFGSKLKNLRLRKNIGQKELAKQLGLNRESIRRYEKNLTRPNNNILTKLAETLNVPVEELQALSYHKNSDFSKNLRKGTQNADK